MTPPANHPCAGATYKSGDEIGVFLNLVTRTVSFYKNGDRIGVAAGPDILTERAYFPAVALYEFGHTVVALAPPPAAAAQAPAGVVPPM